MLYKELNSPGALKLKSGGRGRLFGSRVFGSLSSSKKGWIQASNYNQRVLHLDVTFLQYTRSHIFKYEDLLQCIVD